ncbi:hypothetical protein Tco_0806936 [Tanacetum coccineum]
MHGDQSPKTLNSQQQKKQSKLCEVYKQSYNAKDKSALVCLPKTTTGLTKEKMSEFKTKKPEESSFNWKPLHNDSAATTSKPNDVQAYNSKDNKYRYNRKGFLKDDDSRVPTPGIPVEAWIKFADAVTGTGVKINIEHIEGKHNTLADSPSRLVNLCFPECTGEMKQLAAAALYSVEEVLQSSNAFQKNMKINCEEVMKISNNFQESSQKLSSHMKNQEHYTNITSSKPTKLQS